MMCAACLLPTVAFADDSDVDETSTAVEPADVCVRVALVRDELENLRFVMGRPANTQPEQEVSDTVPREVFFQALTPFRKADRLCFEYTREHAAEPAIPCRNNSTCCGVRRCGRGSGTDPQGQAATQTLSTR